MRALRRRWRRFRRRWFWHGVRFIYNEAYERSLDSVPLDHRRSERILSYLADEGLVARGDIEIPRHPSLRNLLRVHDPEYLESLQDPEVLLRIFGATISDEDLESVVEMQRMMVGGTILATIRALHSRGVAFNLGGGMHHAKRSSGEAFCLFNDIAVAIARLRAKGFKDQVLVVDLDLHDGDGTRSIFARDASVYTYSIHNDHWGDIEAVASTAIALGAEVGDEMLLGTLLKTLPEVVDTVRPGLVIYIAGTDPAADDAIGNWKITPQGMLRRDQFVMRLLRGRRRPIPMVVVLGGGYGDSAWKYTARFISWHLSGRSTEPPGNEELMLQRFRRIRRTLDPASLTSEPDDYAWRLSEEDLAGILPGAPRRSRFLDYFSTHGVELQLERFAILDGMRVRGYRHPAVEVDLSNPVGQTLRVFGAADRHDLLMELRVDRNQRVVPDCEVLVVEWLLLQNPRAHFGPYRRQLPGQKHPGLGMLKEVLGWLVMVCEMLDLDGIYYTPSGYHVAAQSRQFVRFLHPQHEARYRAYREALSEVDLAEASKVVADGRLLDAATGEPIEWEGYPMVLPVTDRLRDRVFGDDYEALVGDELEQLEVKLAAYAPTG
jgi:acetoin utilization deacetylase AcuC-like enzyme